MTTESHPTGSTDSPVPATTAREAHERPPRTLPLYIVGVVLVVLAGAGAFYVRTHRRRAVDREAHTLAHDAVRGPRVTVVPVQLSAAQRDVQLPGDVRAFRETGVYAKVSGYLQAVRVDRGDRVRAGQVLGVVESPDADQQVLSAQTELALRTRIAARSRALITSGVVSAQDTETAEAQAVEAQSSLRRARAQQHYEVITAPFAGVVTARYADVGALLPAATGSTQSALPLLDVAEVDRVRVLVYPGQEVASAIVPGTPAVIRAEGHDEIRATVTRTAGALDARTRTLACEIHLDNTRVGLLPGTFVHVVLHLQVPPHPTIPSDAVFVRGDRQLAAVVQDDRVHLVPIETGVDDGRMVQVTAGLHGGETVVVNVPSELSDGDRVRPTPRREPPPNGAAR